MCFSFLLSFVLFIIFRRASTSTLTDLRAHFLFAQGGAAAVARPGEAPLREPLEFLRRQQLAWTRKLVKRMDKIAATAPGLKMARPRSAAQRGLKWVLWEHLPHSALPCLYRLSCSYQGTPCRMHNSGYCH